MKVKVKGENIEPTELLVIDERKTVSERITSSIISLVSAAVVCVVVIVINSIQYGNAGLTIAMIILLIGWPLLSFLFSPNHRFSLYKEGVYVKERRMFIWRGQFLPWDSFQHFTTDSTEKRFALKVRIGTIRLTSREHFGEVQQILSENIPTKD